MAERSRSYQILLVEKVPVPRIRITGLSADEEDAIFEALAKRYGGEGQLVSSLYPFEFWVHDVSHEEVMRETLSIVSDVVHGEETRL